MDNETISTSKKLTTNAESNINNMEDTNSTPHNKEPDSKLPLNPELDKKQKEKAELDMTPEEIKEVEEKMKLTFKCNIGIGGFSIVKLAYSSKVNGYLAVKIVSFIILHR